MDADYQFKIVLLGDSGVGKTNLMTRFCEDKFDANSKATLGVEFHRSKLKLQDDIVWVDIWDTAGQERFKSLSSVYFRGAMGIILVYDITNTDSFRNISDWLNMALDNGACADCVKTVIGNKSDLDAYRQIDHNTAQTFAAAEKLSFFEASAKESKNVFEAFENIIQEIYNKKKVSQLKKSAVSTVKLTQPRKSIVTSHEDKQSIKPCCAK